MFVPGLLVLQGVLSRWIPNSICTQVVHPSSGQFSRESVSRASSTSCLGGTRVGHPHCGELCVILLGWVLVCAGLPWLCFHLLISRHACLGQGISVVKAGSLCRRPPNSDGVGTAPHAGSLSPFLSPVFRLPPSSSAAGGCW